MPTSGRTRALSIVAAAVKAGRLPPITDKTICVDCGNRANAYDHRDYNKPLEVEPVCHLCNANRGSAIPAIDTDTMERMNFYFTEQQLAALKRLRKQTGLVLAELVRRAIDLLIKTNGGGGGK